MSTVERQERRQSQCPQCHQARGLPVRVVATKEQQVVGLKCPVCGHKWDMAVPETDPIQHR